jgi:formylglycine-generating enzyme required for sulfatase activity
MKKQIVFLGMLTIALMQTMCINDKGKEDPIAPYTFDIDMVLVKGGTFTMGCTSEQENDCEDLETPAHTVTLEDFYIGKYEVTQAKW